MHTARRCVVALAFGTAAVVATAAPAAAANPRASCVGRIVSFYAPAGDFDVRQFKAAGEAMGHPNFGSFVSASTQLSLEECP